MKTLNLNPMKRIIKFLSSLLLSGIILFSGCKNDQGVKPADQSILPENFKVAVPGSMSSANANLRIAGDTLKGNAIYEHLRTFIAIGEGASDIVQGIITGIRVYHINKPLSLTFNGDDDHRSKNLVVTENQEFEGNQWEFFLTITDAESEGNADGGKAIEVFWNRNPVKGIAILKPYNINRGSNWGGETAIVRLDYSEAGEHGYDAEMVVSIADIPLASPLTDPFSVSALKMFVGKKGNNIDVFGNSDHPNAVLFSGTKGFDWAFVGSGLETENIGVAEVGLPPSSLDQSNRTVLLKDYSIKNVFTNEILAVWPNISQDLINAYLYNTEAPGYFNHGGFVSGGTSPGTEYDPLVVRINALSPYNPKDINELIVEFK
jgi:hypothetical protein